MTLTPEDIKRYKNLLQEKRDEVEKRVEDLKKVPDFGDDTDHFEEEGDEAAAFAGQLGLKQNFEVRLEKIGEALDKIKSGTYGACENCGKAISKEILDIDPESEYCHACKEKKIAQGY